MSGQTKATKTVGVSTSELERRWKAVRQAMKQKKLDFLLLQGGGSVRWLTDIPGGAATRRTVIFPRDDEMTIISSGARPPAAPQPPASAVRGVKKRFSVPMNTSLGYTALFDSEIVAAELEPYKNCRIGLVGTSFISAAFYKYITEHFNTAKFEDATDMVDNIKAIKSAEEIALIRENCRLEEELFEYALTRIQPGRMTFEVQADVVHRWTEMTSEGTNIIAGSAPPGKPATFGARFRTIEDGDQFNLLIETIGPGGYWCEITRPICLGKIPAEVEEQFEVAKQVQRVTIDLLKPGTEPMTAWNANNKFLTERGYVEESRLYAHGMGYDMVERPCLMPGETMKVQANMNIVVHPAVQSPTAYTWVCDNYLVHETGEAERLHTMPQKIFVI